MWYFAWLLGLPLAALFAVLNAMWLELREDQRLAEEGDAREREKRGVR
ncbi:cytochrome bd-I oxidase subunit CydX [Maritimibacter sp. DP1N21-5]|nr:cytochrome bd-I oxidase subunit CydX [Maritimibacter sp. DP1N21-5]MBV7408426.1 cytochrome bd-I oxidase subunit CydX [Maritimibacter sp. DP1N21-5]